MANLSGLGRNIKLLRKKMGYTQDQLAERAGIPRATMAGVEKNNSNPTLQVILAIADALGVGVDEMLRSGDPRATLMKFDPEARMTSQDGKYTSVSLSPVDAKRVIINRISMKPGCLQQGRLHARGSQEFFLCLKGTAVLTVVDTEFIIEAGDLIYFNGDQNHTYENRGQDSCEAVAVIAYSNLGE